MTAATRLHAVSDITPAAEAARTSVVGRFELRIENRLSHRTAQVYGGAARTLSAWLSHRDDPRGFGELSDEDIDDFLGAFWKGRDGFTVHAQSYVSQIYRSLCSFYDWHSERYEHTNPMAKVTARLPGETDLRSKVLTDAQLKAVLATVEHRRDFTSIRDVALLRLLLTGVRRAELVSLAPSDIDLPARLVHVQGKGDASGPRFRDVPFGNKTAEAVDDYLELRERHRLAWMPQLWVGHRGPLTGRGLHMIVKKRGEQAGIAGLHPHMFRHTAAHRWLADDGGEGDLMENMGWKSRAMVDHYASHTRKTRAQAASRKHGLDDRI